MAVEVFHPIYLETIAPIGVAIVGWLWRKLKTEDGRNPTTLEIDHIKPRYKGGTDDPENLQVVSRVEHALKHWRDARQQNNRRYRRNELSAVSMIVKRMSDTEREEFNRRLNDDNY